MQQKGEKFMLNTNQKFKICGKVKSVSIVNCEIIVKLRPNYKDEYLLLEKVGSDNEMHKYKADEKEFFRHISFAFCCPYSR